MSVVSSVHQVTGVTGPCRPCRLYLVFSESASDSIISDTLLSVCFLALNSRM